MSFIAEQIQRIDAHLDRVQLAAFSSASSHHHKSSSRTSTTSAGNPTYPSRLLSLQSSIRALSPSETSSVATYGGATTSKANVGSSTSRYLLRPEQIQHLLSTSLLHPAASPADSQYAEDLDPGSATLEAELEWLLVSKATTQVYGHVLTRILDAAVRLEEEVWYWDEVLASPRATALYSIQTSPGRLLGWGKEVWGDVVVRTGGGLEEGLRKGWREFYGLVRDVVRERSVEQVRGQVLGPLRRLREEVRSKQMMLRRLRLRNANALGVLLGEGLANESVRGEDGELLVVQLEGQGRKRWRGLVGRNVALMEAVLVRINELDSPLERFDATVAELTDDDPLYMVESHDGTMTPHAVAERLVRLLAIGLPDYVGSTQSLAGQHGRPSRLVRYWLPVTIGILSSSTILRVLFNRQAQIVQGIEDLGATILDFWRHWVVEPTRNLIKTIRHDEGSEISIMSKRSLQGDRESLERMVVDFAIQNPANATGSSAPLTEADIADIRAKVREGDLTPVLRAYEKDMASPLMGTLRGNLIRALLIQVQKTKVDVEVAMGGIDALLKSQELCIGIIGLTPGLLITYSLLLWLRNSFSEKRGSQTLRKQGKMLRQLRNIDRILTSSTPTDFGELMYKDQGLLLCEIHVLRETATKTMPSEIYKEFGEEMDELCDVRVGVQRQRSVVERTRWAYGKWLA